MQPNQPHDLSSPAHHAATAGHHYYYSQQQSSHEQQQQQNAGALAPHPPQHAAVALPPIAAPPVPGAPALPPGWVAIVDTSTGRTYYGNPLTGDTSWEVPSLPPPPPTKLQHQPQQPQPAPAQYYHAVGSVMPNNTQPTVPTAPVITQLLQSSSDALPATMHYLVPQVRSMMDAEQSAAAATLSSSSEPPPPLELADLTAGAVADLVNVKREQASAAGEEVVPYDPIEPYRLPVLVKPPHIEPGRVEIRANLMYDKLEKL